MDAVDDEDEIIVTPFDFSNSIWAPRLEDADARDCYDTDEVETSTSIPPRHPRFEPTFLESNGRISTTPRR